MDRPCEPSLQAWSPELHLYHMNMTVPCPAEGCSLELLFQHPVQADTLTLWVTYLSMGSSPVLFDTEILLEHQKSVHLGPLDTFCARALCPGLEARFPARRLQGPCDPWVGKSSGLNPFLWRRARDFGLAAWDGLRVPRPLP